MRIRESLGLGAAIFGLFAAATALVFWAWLPHLSTALIGPPEDNLQDFWNSWYAAAAAKPQGFFHTDLIRYPEGLTLYYHSFAYPQVALLVALTKLFGTAHTTLVALQNLTLLLSFPVAGTGAWFLARHFGVGPIAALASGFVFAFNPSHVAHAMHHAHVGWIGFIPFFVLAYLIALERKSTGWLAAASVLYALSALCCWYYLFYLLFFLVFHLVYLRVHEKAWPRGWPLLAPALCLMGTVLLLSPWLVPMMWLAGNSNAYSGGTNVYVADVAGYFTFPPTHALAAWTSDLFARIAPNRWEGTVYLGLINLALLAWLCIRRRGPPLGYLIGGMITFAVFASGETLHAFGHDFGFLHLPDIVLSKLPFFANVRTPSRAIVMVYLFLGIAVGTALTLLARERRSAIVAAAVALLLLDFYPVPRPMTDMRCPRELGAIGGGAVLDLPSGYVEGNIYMARQTCHGHPILQGNIARVLSTSLVDRLGSMTMEQRRAALKAAHVGTVVITEPEDGLFQWPREDGARADYERAFRTLARGPRLTVLKVD
ncbi:MAG TPA: hypothetical protein VG819_06550 [Rhizomicrobium sp.]|nr:hypothetical protein [Rhizomicrobium sp.]